MHVNKSADKHQKIPYSHANPKTGEAKIEIMLI
jgi:hypothetical protein